jgi:hypothetical protein
MTGPQSAGAADFTTRGNQAAQRRSRGDGKFYWTIDRLLARIPALSPELDRLAAEGLLFERCYATGERTIQGLEAAVCSFPPLPGAGVVKRPQARQNFATLASVLKGRGYATRFFYGGQGDFRSHVGVFHWQWLRSIY